MPRRSPPKSSARPPHPAGGPPPRSQPAGERLQKVLAAAGVASRRECESLILEGRVEVDHQVVTELGTRVDPSRQEIRVDGTALQATRPLYFLVNKPVGVVCTNRDPAGRTRVVDLVGADQRLFPVGRLDRSSEGAIVVTNDGALANRLTHPRYGIQKTYEVRVAGYPAPEELQSLRRGIHLAEGLAKVVSIKVKRRHRLATDLEIVLDEGRNREIRRILARTGHKVLQLKRTAIGSLRLGSLPLGHCRRLTPTEVQGLTRNATAAPDRRARPLRRTSRGVAGQEPGAGEQNTGDSAGKKTGDFANQQPGADKVKKPEGAERGPGGAKHKKLRAPRGKSRPQPGRRGEP